MVYHHFSYYHLFVLLGLMFHLPMKFICPFSSWISLIINDIIVHLWEQNVPWSHLIMVLLQYQDWFLSLIHFLWQGNVILDESTNSTYCSYSSDVATGYGVGGFLFLLSSESLLMGVTKCMCFGRPLAPGNSRAWTIIYFFLSWWGYLCFGILDASIRNFF